MIINISTHFLVTKQNTRKNKIIYRIYIAAKSIITSALYSVEHKLIMENRVRIMPLIGKNKVLISINFTQSRVVKL